MVYVVLTMQTSSILKLFQGYEKFLNFSRNSFADPGQSADTVRERKVCAYSKFFLDPIRGNLERASLLCSNGFAEGGQGSEAKEKEKLPPRQSIVPQKKCERDCSRGGWGLKAKSNLAET